MAPHLALTKCLLVAAIAAYCSAQTNTARAYDTSDWIPLVSNEKSQESTRTQKNARVLNLAPSTYQKNFFPGQQSFRETIFTPPQQAHNAQRFQQQIQQPQNAIIQEVPKQQQQILSQSAPLIQSFSENLTPQFLPRLEAANFNLQGNPYLPQQFIVPSQQFIQPFNPQSHLIQPQHDFNLLQQVIQNPNVQFVDQLLALNQTQNAQNNNFNVKQENVQLSNSGQQVQEAIQQNLNKNEYISSSTVLPPPTATEKQEVQLLYVPLETLKQRKEKAMLQEPSSIPKQQQIYPSTEKVAREAFTEQPPQHLYQQNYRKHAQLQSIQQDFAQQALQAQQLQHIIQNNYQTTNRPISTTSVPLKKKTKLKAHQPPLAIFMDAKNHEHVKVTDLLTVLKDAKTISVLDQVSLEMPQVFVGPSALPPPNGYAKFELPYLSTIEHNRNQRKVDHLPFFVAPLSYKTPEGYSKIPFPAPHVGSVVVSQINSIDNTPDKLSENPTTVPNKYFNVEEVQNTQSIQRQRSRNQRLPTKLEDDISAYINNERNPTQLVNNGGSLSVTNQQTLNQNDFLSSLNAFSLLNNNQQSTTSPNSFLSNISPSSSPIPNYSVISNPTTPASSNIYKGHFVTHGELKPSTVIEPESTVTRRPVEHNFKTTGLPQTSIEEQKEPQYTVLEQFSIRQPTTQKILQTYISTEKPIMKTYSQADFEQYRSDPVGINDQFGTAQQNEELLPAKVLLNQRPVQHHVSSSTIRPRPTQIQEVSPSHEQVRVQPHRGNQQKVRYQTITRENNAQHQQPAYILQNENNLGQHQIKNEQVYSQEDFLMPKVVSSTQRPLERHSPQLIAQTNNQEYTDSISPNSYKVQVKEYQQVPVTVAQENQYSIQNSQVHQHHREVSSTPSQISSQQQHFEQVYSTQSPRVEISTHSPINNRGHVNYNSYRAPINEQQINLPGQLPAINPNLPGLINSLQDSQFQQVETTTLPVIESVSELATPHRSTTHSPTPTFPSRKTSTRGRPRIPSRQPVSSTVTPTSSRISQTRRRRPYNGRPRPEYEKYLTSTSTEGQYLVEITPTTTEPPFSHPVSTHQAYIDVTTPKPTTRSRYNYQRDQEVYTTEPPKRTVNVRQRFRTRGRTPSTTTTTTTEAPILTDSVNDQQSTYELTERSSITQSSPAPSFQAPNFESGFEASPPFLTHKQNINQQQETFSQNTHHPNESPIYQHGFEEYYVQDQKNNAQDVVAVQINNAELNTQFSPSTEQSHLYSQSQQPLEQSPSPIDYSQQPVVTTTETLNRYIHNEPVNEQGVNRYISESATHTPTININSELNSRYNEHVHSSSEKSYETTTTQKPVIYRSRGRTRGRPRNSYSTTPSTTTTTFAAVKQPEPEEEEEEYYGFFRKPDFQRPVDDSAYVKSSEIRQHSGTSSNNPDNNAYFSPTQRGSTVSDSLIYIDGTENPSQSPLIIYDDPVNSDKTISNQHPVYTSPSYEEQPPTTEAQTRKPYEGNFNNRGVRPARPTHATVSTTTRASHRERYTVRPTKRPEPVEAPKVTRIRGRIRKPTRPTTTTTEETVEQNNYQPQIARRRPYYQQQSTANELVNTDIEEPVTKPRSRTPTRGRGHYKYPKSTTEARGNDGLEGANYPAAFLQAQEAKTQRPEFKITVGTFEEEDSDQVPYSSVNRPEVIKSPEDGVEESQWSTKYSPGAFNKGYTNIIRKDNKSIFSDESNSTSINEEKVNAEKTQVNENPENNKSKNLNSKQENVDKSIFDQIFDEMSKFGMKTEIETSTEKMNDKDELVGEIKFMKGKKRGFWRKVRVKPIDSLETAESQNIASSANDLISDSMKKSHPQPYIEQYVITIEPQETTDPVKIELQTEIPLKTSNEEDTMITVVPERPITNIDVTEESLETTTTVPESVKEEQSNDAFDILNPLFEMFDIIKKNPMEEIRENEFVTIENQDVTTVDYSPTDLTEENTQFTTDIPLTTMPNLRDLDISTESQLNETKIISDKIKQYTDRIENQSEQSKINIDETQPIGTWDPLIIGTSTSTEISHETEICFRGRCVKSNSTESIENK